MIKLGKYIPEIIERVNVRNFYLRKIVKLITF